MSELTTGQDAATGDGLRDLLVRVANGDQAAFESLYRDTAGTLLGICLRVLADRAEAEEPIAFAPEHARYRALETQSFRLDRLDELGLLHRAGPGNAHAPGHRLQVGDQHGVEPATALLRRVCAAGGGGFDGFRHVRSFPRISAEPARAVGFWSLLPRPTGLPAGEGT